MPRNADRLAAYACAGLLAVISLGVLAGWIFHLPQLTRVSPTFAPTQFNTALCFFLYAVGVLAGSEGNKWIPRVFAGMICMIGAVTLCQTFVGRDVGIDTVFGYFVRAGRLGAPVRMADATAAALLALGTTLGLGTFLRSWSRAISAAMATLGSVPLAVAAGALLGFGADAHSLTGWIGFTRIGAPTALLCGISGAHLLWTAWQRSEGDEAWLPIPILFGLLALVLTLTQELRDNEAAALSARVQASAQQFADRAHVRLYDMFAAFDRMASRWKIGEGTAEAVWSADARAYLRDYRGLVALECIDGEGKVRWVVPPLARPEIIEERLRTEPIRALPALQARRSATAQVTKMMGLTHGGIGFLYMKPLTNSRGYDGLQIGVVRISDFLQGVFGPADTAQYAILLVADGVRMSPSGGAVALASEWTRSVVLPVRNANWTLSVTPSGQMVSQSLSATPWVFFGVGCFVSILMTLNVFLALKWSGNLKALREKEDQLERSDERYEIAVRGAGVGLWDFNLTTGELYWSPRYREFLGIDDPSFVPPQTEFESRVHREDRSRVFSEISRAIEHGVPYDGEARVRRNDGSYIWLRLRGIPTRDAGGKLVRLSGSVDDISALKGAEDALRASEETFRVTMDSAPVGISLMSPDKRLLRANRAMATLLGCSHEDELFALDPRKVLPSAFDDDRAHMDRLLAGDIDRYEFEHEVVTGSGKRIWVLASASLALNPDGSPRHIVKQLIDISERKEMDRMKSEFISVVSHELRTPLTAIRGSLGLMAAAMRDTLPPKAHQLVEIANRNCERLMALVDDILDMEKLAADRMPLDLRQQDIELLVRQSLEANSGYADKYTVSFRLRADGENRDAFVDSCRFGQIMANLLSNAAKFSPQGAEVEISVQTCGDSVRVEVRDHGPGIPGEFRSRIFGRFMQADSSITRAKGGTGLGLHITKQLVERMGGRIGFESATGQGTVFWFEFPLVSVKTVRPMRAAS